MGDAASDEQQKLYSEHLAQGHYLVMIDGSDEEIEQAESLLSQQGIQDWYVYATS